MEAEIHRYQGYLKTSSKEANICTTIVGTVEENLLMSSNLIEGDKLATQYEQKCNTLKGAVKFKPLVLDHAGFSFTYLGSSAKTCTVLCFNVTSPTHITVDAKVDPTLFDGLGSFDSNRLFSMSSFLQIRMKFLCEYMCQQVLCISSDIPSCLRRFEHLIGRLESTAAEFAKLNERYRGKMSLSHVANSSLFHLKISFQNQIGLSQLGASFAISEVYPFSPLSVSLDSYDPNVDVEAIQKSMVKNAKPGFGYLSRICDVVEVSLRRNLAHC